MNKYNHFAVYHEPEIYAGWPANHGAWQWGDEFLVGFMRGRFDEDGRGIHPILEPYQKIQARSLDGGRNWSIEIPNCDFNCINPSPAPAFDLKSVIIRVCGNYDTGGDVCHHDGGFYLSSDRGKTWEGPYFFSGLEDVYTGHNWNTSRTMVVDGTVFLSLADDRYWATDSVFTVRHDGMLFHNTGIVLNDNCRAVMPSAVKIGNEFYCAMRRKGFANNWIDLYKSNGPDWARVRKVADTLSFNGNPPALAESDGYLYCAYAVRDRCEMVVSRSDDLGVTWKESVIRTGESKDVGYPQFLKRSDGTLLCFYYWSDKDEPPHIAMTEIPTN